MTESTRQTLRRQTWRLVWRSFLAAAVVGSIGGGLATAIIFGVASLTNPWSENRFENTFEQVMGGLFGGPLIAWVFWIPAWLAITVLAILWLWIWGELPPKPARYVLSLVAFTLLLLLFNLGESGWPRWFVLVVAIIAGVGVWVTVPWILRPQRDNELRPTS